MDFVEEAAAAKEFIIQSGLAGKQIVARDKGWQMIEGAKHDASDERRARSRVLPAL